MSLYGERKNVDIVTLTDRLREDGVLEAVGGAARLTELVEFVPTAANVLHYGRYRDSK